MAMAWSGDGETDVSALQVATSDAYIANHISKHIVIFELESTNAYCMDLIFQNLLSTLIFTYSNASNSHILQYRDLCSKAVLSNLCDGTHWCG